MATQRTFSAEEAQKKFEALPPEIKSILYTPEVTSVIQKVGEKNHLHYDQMGILEIETSNVMLGFTEPKDLPEILMRSLNIEHVPADAIIQDLNDLLFTKIRDAMKKVYNAGPSTDGTKSVVMPSTASKPINPSSPIPAPKTTPVSAPASTSTPKLIEIHAADLMLNEPTVSMAPKTAAPAVSSSPTTPAAPTSTAPAGDSAKVEPPKPAPYKADPYREPPE